LPQARRVHDRRIWRALLRRRQTASGVYVSRRILAGQRIKGVTPLPSFRKSSTISPLPSNLASKQGFCAHFAPKFSPQQVDRRSIHCDTPCRIKTQYGRRSGSSNIVRRGLLAVASCDVFTRLRSRPRPKRRGRRAVRLAFCGSPLSRAPPWPLTVLSSNGSRRSDVIACGGV
jgi:hypothetical protein